MSKKGIILLVISACFFLLFCTWFFADEEDYEIHDVGISKTFEYDSKEIITSLYGVPCKKELLYKYYYSEEKEEGLIQDIISLETWQKIEDMENVDFYFSYGIEKIDKGYLHYFNYDYYNEVYDEYDYYNNIKLGGTISQFYTIVAIDTEKNVIWYFETERIITS